MAAVAFPIKLGFDQKCDLATSGNSINSIFTTDAYKTGNFYSVLYIYIPFSCLPFWMK